MNPAPSDFSTWRSVEIQAHRDGWNAQRQGKDQTRCPYGAVNASMRMAWLTGWQHGNDLALAEGAKRYECL